MAVLDREPISKALEINVDTIIHEQLELIRAELEEKSQQNSLAGQAIDELRNIQWIVDEARKISESSQLRLGERLKEVLKKVDEASSAIKYFRQAQKQLLPDQINNDLRRILDSCKEKLDSVNQKLELIQNSLTQITVIENLEENSDSRVFQSWAEAIDIFAEGVEDFFGLGPTPPLGPLEDFARDLLSTTSKTNYETTQKEEYRRRLKYAASFILTLIRKKRYESVNEESAEAKAIERLADLDKTEWITVSEPERTINVDKINTRLKQRGYNIQIPCEDSP